MKYYSEVTKKLYDSEEELLKDETTREEKMTKEKKMFEEVLMAYDMANKACQDYLSEYPQNLNKILKKIF